MDRMNQMRAKSMVAVVAAALLLPAEERRNVTSDKIAENLIPILTSGVGTLVEINETAQMRRELSQVAFALALHRAENKTYPATLAELLPKYMAKVPIDRFAGNPLRYQRTAAGYLLFSIGSDLKDDGGWPTDELGQPADLVVSLPVQTAK